MTGEKKFLSASEIFAFDDLKHVDVEVPEWGGQFVRLQSLNGKQAALLMDIVDNKKTSAVRLLAMCAVDQSGEPLFTEDDVEKLQKKNWAAILRLQNAAMKLNSMTEGGPAETKND